MPPPPVDPAEDAHIKATLTRLPPSMQNTLADHYAKQNADWVDAILAMGLEDRRLVLAFAGVPAYPKLPAVPSRGRCAAPRKKKDFIAGYKTYDPTKEARGSPAA